MYQYVWMAACTHQSDIIFEEDLDYLVGLQFLGVIVAKTSV